jgi:hypothetical protein
VFVCFVCLFVVSDLFSLIFFSFPATGPPNTSAEHQHLLQLKSDMYDALKAEHETQRVQLLALYSDLHAQRNTWETRDANRQATVVVREAEWAVERQQLLRENDELRAALAAAEISV